MILVANDHVFKGRWPAAATGKISDFAGLFFFPLLLLAVSEILLATTSRNWRAGRARLSAVVAVTAAGFVAVKVSPVMGEFYGSALGLLRWPVEAARNAASGQAWPEVVPARIRTDTTDLLALFMLGPSWLYGRAWIAKRTRSG